MRTLFSFLIFSLSLSFACSKSSPSQAADDRSKAPLKVQKSEAPAKTKSSAPPIECPPKTKAIQSTQALGLARYCRGELGKEGPFEITDKQKRLVLKGTYKNNRRASNFELFEEGVPRATALIKEGKLEGLRYKTKATPKLKSNIVDFLRAEIAQTQSCTLPSDCVAINAPCPIACSVIINKAHQKRVEKWFADFDAPCERKCKKQSALTDCVNNQCVRKNH